ncbi:T9SS type A sorting domain-containing protein [uncultured Polaribacter sp.]|uniref:T9SS type A sorting domain-containing protein n=1 Tax=uncultured Polaribacter sp. TaxID=174711 RepID=UPI00260F66F1|nr:T9SS type A sorting domain-containing protein [uncultured Polaribacter sp.]
MVRNSLKILLFLYFSFFSFLLNAQIAVDEDTGSYTTCNEDGANETRTSDDLPNPINVGAIDDRSCYANYKESTIDGTVWGIYNITAGSNDKDNLQPRIERSLDRSQTSGIGSFARFTGTVRILEVGSGFRGGSYIMQAKGKHTGGGGSADPAICLFIAYPVYGNDENGNEVQLSFDLFKEQILNREGRRELVFLKNIKKNTPTDIELEVGFREDPNDSSKKIHYADAVIGGEVFNWNIPEPERGIQSGIRYGAYRVWEGRAQIRWANTTYEKKEVIAEREESDGLELADKVYNLKNVASGKFLNHLGEVATPVIMTDSDEGANSLWSFEERGNFYNIDSNNFGVLRGTGLNFIDGAYAVVSTEFEPPVSDSDKSWIIHYNESDNSYRFESNSSRFLYHEVNGNVTHLKVSDSDPRSKWKLVLIDKSLNLFNQEFQQSSLNLYPNPTNNQFTIAINNLDYADIQIYNVLGKAVFSKIIKGGAININTDDKFTSGVYLVKVISKENKVYHKKIMIK